MTPHALAEGIHPEALTAPFDPMLFELHRDLDERTAQLAAVCSEFGVEPPSGVMTMRRLRALENVRDLVEQCARGEVGFDEVREAAAAAGRQP